MVDSRHHLDAVVLASFRVSEHETEAEVLLVWQIYGVEREAAVELADALVNIGVLAEELQLHRVALRVVDGGGSDHVVDLGVGGGVGIDLSQGLASVLLDEAGEAKFGQLSDHMCEF